MGIFLCNALLRSSSGQNIGLIRNPTLPLPILCGYEVVDFNHEVAAIAIFSFLALAEKVKISLKCAG